MKQATTPRTARLMLALACLALGAHSASAGDGQAVALRPGKAGSPLTPRYSPKGTKIPLTPVEKNGLEGVGHLQGRLLLGPPATRGQGHALVLARSAEGKAYDLLWIDEGGDGSIANDEVQRVKSRTSRGSVWTSYAASKLRVNHGSLKTPAWEPYPINLWVVVPSVGEVPAFIRFSRRGFLVGTVSIGDEPHDVVVSDGNNDAILDAGDWWTLRRSGGKRAVGIQDSRRIGDFTWAGKLAYKLVLEGTAGRAGRVIPFDPGITPEEDARKRDPYWDDKHAERAAAPATFVHGFEAGRKEARARGAFVFLDFETDWCGPCKSMDRWVYTAKDVVAAARGIVCIKVDGDERKDLKAAHKVGSFPTGILLDPAGKEVARFSGYQSAAQMVTFLAKAHANR